ncbi:ESCRT-III subunit protein snf7 [Agyrium rufum]|nr:ESCRT-III subunit protein snf7 [Agyrium rufum]
MSGWGAWFGGASTQKRKDAPKKAILDLRQNLDMLQKREKHLENQMAEQDAIARKNISTNKTAAKTALKRKKAHEHSLEQTSAQIAMLENQIYSIESANINQETLTAIKNASNAMKDIHGTMTIDKVDEIMYSLHLLPAAAAVVIAAAPLSYTRENLGEQRQLAEEIGNAISSGGVGNEVDETELNEELEQMEQEALDDKLVNTGPLPQLPASMNGAKVKEVKAPVVAQEEDEEEELRKLQAEMAM